MNSVAKTARSHIFRIVDDSSLPLPTPESRSDVRLPAESVRPDALSPESSRSLGANLNFFVHEPASDSFRSQIAAVLLVCPDCDGYTAVGRAECWDDFVASIV